MKILFINAISKREISENETAILESLGPAYLASSLRHALGKDKFEFRIASKDIENEIDSFKPDLIGISSVTQNYNIAKEHAGTARKKNVPVMVGGLHISMMPLSLDKNMDVGVVGEGEETIVELVRLFQRDHDFKPSELKKINGLVFHDGEKLHQTPKRALIEPLDRIPMPARDLLKIKKFAYMFSSRGCPYRCCFCSSSRFWEKVRFFSAAYVLNEIKELHEKYGVEKITFMDDLFIADKKRLEEIVGLLKEIGLNRKIEFWVEARANLVDEKTVGLLKEMNVTNVTLGLESGCQRTLEFLKGKGITVEHNRNAVRLLKKHGIKVFSFFVIGSPYETRDDIMETLRFIQRNKIDTFKTFVLTPLPATPMWEYARGRGMVSDDMDWGRLDVNFDDNHEKAIVLSETLSKDELHELYLLFEREREKKYKSSLLKAGLKKPHKIPAFLLRKVLK